MDKITETREAALTKLRDGQKNALSATVTLIITELAADIDSREKVAEKAARRLRDTITALAEPQKRLAAAKSEVEKCQQRIDYCRSQAEDADLDTRVDAEIWLWKYQDQLPALEQKADTIQNEVNGLEYDKRQAQQQLDAEQAFIRAHKAAMLDPFRHPLAQQTQAYIGYRLPTILVDVITSGDTENPEWAIAHQMIGQLLYVSGISREDYDLPNTGLIDTSAIYKNPDQHIGKQPSGQEVMAQNRVLTDNLTAIPTTSPEYLTPRPARITRPEMDVQELPERYKRI